MDANVPTISNAATTHNNCIAIANTAARASSENLRVLNMVLPHPKDYIPARTRPLRAAP